ECVGGWKPTGEWERGEDGLAAARGSDRDTNDTIARAFRRLPPDLQIVAALALLEEQPYAEIADALGIPEGTVKSRVFRATRALREELVRLGIRPRTPSTKKISARARLTLPAPPTRPPPRRPTSRPRS